MGRCNESDDAQEDRACGETLCDVHLPCAEVLYRASLPRVDCDLFEWQKIEATCGGKKRKPMQGCCVTIVLGGVANGTRDCFKSAWTNLVCVDHLAGLVDNARKRPHEFNYIG